MPRQEPRDGHELHRLAALGILGALGGARPSLPSGQHEAIWVRRPNLIVPEIVLVLKGPASGLRRIASAGVPRIMYKARWTGPERLRPVQQRCRHCPDRRRSGQCRIDGERSAAGLVTAAESLPFPSPPFPFPLPFPFPSLA
eukprot:scaffold222_cov117-Pinguiococcus_pyrenoidosus.AAC.1